MANDELLYLKSQNIWFGIDQKDINFVKMNQKPGWFPKAENGLFGYYLMEDKIFRIVHLNAVFGDSYKAFSPAHMVILKSEIGNYAIACDELKTQLDLPMASDENYPIWLKEKYQQLLTHWFPVEKEKFIVTAV